MDASRVAAAASYAACQVTEKSLSMMWPIDACDSQPAGSRPPASRKRMRHIAAIDLYVVSVLLTLRRTSVTSNESCRSRRSDDRPGETRHDWTVT